MDVQLPGMDGLEATRKLKEDARTRDIPVVLGAGPEVTLRDLPARIVGAEPPHPIDGLSYRQAVDGARRSRGRWPRARGITRRPPGPSASTRRIC